MLALAAPLRAQDGECGPCREAGYPVLVDVNADGSVDLSDGVYLLDWLFLGGPAPDCPAPGGGGDAAEPCCVSCGDANGDDDVDISDPVHVLSWLFLGGDAPACRPAAPPPEACAFPSLVVDGDWLEARLTDPAIDIVDVRSSADYSASRIPGALRVDGSSVRATIDGVPGQVAPSAAVEEVFRAAGLRRDAAVVVYGYATDTTPARLVWTLRYYGHEDALFLDGGWRAWSGRARPMETGPAVPRRSDYAIAGAVETLRVEADWIAARLDDPDVVLVDARSSAEYASGHLPGARSVDWQRNVSGGSFKPFAEVRSLYDGIDPGATVITYCQTGSRASVAWLALRWVGFPDVRVYDGSWAEWGSRPDLPRETE